MFSATRHRRRRRRCAAARRAGSAPSCTRISERSRLVADARRCGPARRAAGAGRPAPRPAPPGRCPTRRRCRRSRPPAPRGAARTPRACPGRRRARQRIDAQHDVAALARLARAGRARRLVAHHHARHRVGRQVGDPPAPRHAPAAQHRHLVGELHHLAELVRDHQDRQAALLRPSRAAGPAPRPPRTASAPTSARRGSRSSCRGRAASGSRASASRPRRACAPAATDRGGTASSP